MKYKAEDCKNFDGMDVTTHDGITWLICTGYRCADSAECDREVAEKIVEPTVVHFEPKGRQENVALQ